MWTRGRATVSGLFAVLVVAGCAVVEQPSGGMGGAGMMGGDKGDTAYHSSTPTCTAPADLPGATVTALLGDMGMTAMMGGTAPLGAHMMLHVAPQTVPAGTITFLATNMGWRAHELVILPLADGAVAGRRVAGPDGRVDETGSLGEASASCASGAGDGIQAGTSGWTTVTLAPGRYELVCNLPNHYADGMHQELVVTG